jgi:hypothetical protein
MRLRSIHPSAPNHQKVTGAGWSGTLGFSEPVHDGGTLGKLFGESGRDDLFD